jgi:hypothetical protein
MHDPEFAWFPALPAIWSRLKEPTPSAKPPSLPLPGRPRRRGSWLHERPRPGRRRLRGRVGGGGPLAGQTDRLKFLVAVRPGFVAPRSPRRWSPPSTSSPRTAPRQRRHRGLPGRARRRRRFHPARRTLRPHRRVHRGHAQILDGAPVRPRREVLPVEGCRPFIKCASQPHPPLYAGGASGQPRTCSPARSTATSSGASRCRRCKSASIG